MDMLYWGIWAQTVLVGAIWLVQVRQSKLFREMAERHHEERKKNQYHEGYRAGLLAGNELREKLK